MKKDKTISYRMNSKQHAAIMKYLNSSYSDRLEFYRMDPRTFSQLIDDAVNEFIKKRNIKF